MLIKPKAAISSAEITDERHFTQRRSLIKALLASGASGVLPVSAANLEQTPPLSATQVALVQSYNNYYEFAFDKESVRDLAQALPTDHWSVEIGGEVEKPGKFYLEDILRQQPLEERLYRFRCVEAWSMVVPWLGFPLQRLLAQVKPLSSAKFVKFTSVYQPEFMPNQERNLMLAWPYVEALRIDEAMHPLTILATGMYGKHLPKQNGAPLRLVVPWKYGFKSIKAIVKIELQSKPPVTTWNKSAPHEYGFYANVNPDVSHPRWSQATERPLGSAFFTARRNTELFNGYAEQVASLYTNMDLRHFF